MDKVFDKWTFARFQKVLCLAFGACMLSLALTACGDSSDDVAGGSAEEEGIIAIKDKTVSGVSQKGPFVNGSSVQLFELNGKTYAPTGRAFPGKISNDKGEFKIAGINLESQYAFLEATGYYRNEVTGEKSAAPITLNAISDLSKRETVNINLLTHLEYERVMKLVEDGMSIAKAKKQAEQEVFAAFGIEGNFDNSEDLNIFESSEADAALLAISIILQGERSEADLSELLANFAQDIAEDGKWDDGKMQATVADWISNANYAQVRSNVEGWNLSDDVPVFEKYLNVFWWQNFGLGDCSKKNQSEIKQNSNELSAYYGIHFICAESGWRIATDLEKDTYKWNEGSKNPSDICKDGDVMKGKVNSSYVYVCRKGIWQAGEGVDAELGGCTEARSLEVANSSMGYMICRDEIWETATDYEKDTYRWEDGENGEGRRANVTKDVYVFDKSLEKWRLPNSFWEIPRDFFLNPDIEYDELVDSRDKQIYKTVKIGDQVWMAQNLNYDYNKGSAKSFCFGNKAEYCEVAGRLYTWAAAIDSVALANDTDDSQTCGYGETCTLPTVVQGVCPEGWHMPTYEEWNTLFTAIGGQYKAGTALKSGRGWNNNGNGTDAYGFSALPAGFCGYEGDCFDAGESAYFWCAREYDGVSATQMNLGYDMLLYDIGENLYLDGMGKAAAISVRCVQN
ncbi:MAG: fibrobacter succinogenes major paralogous domain-containing protein [Fibrobacter sp.]|nr:fibrobacter succinogenes major paralogous domain-containing protein [Fibrobacter sp.]